MPTLPNETRAALGGRELFCSRSFRMHYPNAVAYNFSEQKRFDELFQQTGLFVRFIFIYLLKIFKICGIITM